MIHETNTTNQSPRMRLFTPGPVSVHPEVLAELGKPPIFHRYDDFKALFSETIMELERLFGCSPNHACVLLTGSGTLACEAVLSSVFNETDLVLVVSNGDFGERWARLLGLLGVSLEHEQLGYFKPIDPQTVLRRVRASQPNGLVIVATETSTGMVNPVEEVGQLLKQDWGRSIVYFVDAVSAFGCEPLHMEEFRISHCASVLNKALEGPPGLSIACVDRVALDSSKRTPRSLYLDIRRYLEFRDKGRTPYTPAIPQIRALNIALRRLAKEGIPNRRHRYEALTTNIIQHLELAGFRPAVSIASLRSPAVVTFSIPGHISADALQAYLLARGLVLWFPKHYCSPDEQALMIVSVMGEVDESDVQYLVHTIHEFAGTPPTSWR